MTDYGEPWGYKRTDEGFVITLQLDGEPINIAWIASEPEENMYLAQRIVACVNACKGINPEAVPMFINILKTVQADWAGSDSYIPELDLVLAKAYEEKQ